MYSWYLYCPWPSSSILVHAGVMVYAGMNFRAVIFSGNPILWFHLESILIFRRIRRFQENFREFQENFQEFQEFRKLKNEGEIPFCSAGITPLHSPMMQSRFPVKNNCRHGPRMIVSSNSRHFPPDFQEFQEFQEFRKPNRCQKAQISSKWSQPPPHKFYMFNNTIGCDSVPIFSRIGAGPSVML